MQELSERIPEDAMTDQKNQTIAEWVGFYRVDGMDAWFHRLPNGVFTWRDRMRDRLTSRR